MTVLKKSTFAGLIVLLAALLLQPIVQAEELRIEGAWARPNPPVVPNGAAYLTIHNEGANTRQLLNVSGQIASRIEIHESYTEQGVMKMRHLAEGIRIEPGTAAHLQPGGLHIMLMGLRAPLAEGESFELTLHFDNDIALLTTVLISTEPPQ